MSDAHLVPDEAPPRPDAVIALLTKILEAVERLTDSPTLFVTDEELIRRSGCPRKIARQALDMLDADPKLRFPQKDPFWGGRRFYPAVIAFLNDYYRGNIGASVVKVMKQMKETGFAAVNILTKPPHIMIWSTRGSARGAREAIIENWPRRSGEDDKGRWKTARRDGVRIRQIEVRTTKR